MGTSPSPPIAPQPLDGSLGVPGATIFTAVPGICGCYWSMSLFGWVEFLFNLSFYYRGGTISSGRSVCVAVSWALSKCFGIVLQTADF